MREKEVKMPNWCSTHLTITGDHDQLQRLNQELDLAEKIPSNTDFRKGWLGNLLLHTGMSNDAVCYGEIHCRGEITYRDYGEEEGEITIDTETAWGPCLEVFTRFLDHFNLDKLEVIYTAEESGQDLYWTNDPSEAGTWIFDSWEPEKMPEPFAGMSYEFLPEEEMNKMLSDALGETGETKDLAGKFMYEYEDCSIHVYEFCPIEDLD